MNKTKYKYVVLRTESNATNILGVNSSLRKAREFIISVREDALKKLPDAKLVSGNDTPENTVIAYTSDGQKQTNAGFTALRVQEDAPYGNDKALW